ncbi:Sorting nexin-6 [Dissostichus eleginoides]|nr:Sorting nexin-6 [Dissostichus eleginoides]
MLHDLQPLVTKLVMIHSLRNDDGTWGLKLTEESSTSLQKCAGAKKLIDFKTRRVSAFRKNLVELAELELKHAKGNLQLLQSCMGVLKGNT